MSLNQQTVPYGKREFLVVRSGVFVLASSEVGSEILYQSATYSFNIFEEGKKINK